MHGKNVKKCLLAITALLVLSSQARLTHAYFLDLGGGVRPTGMGEAFTAVADDVNAMQYNSAGLSRLKSIELTGMYSNLYSNLNLRLYNQEHDHLGYNLLAAAAPVPELAGSLGLTWKQFDTTFYQENMLLLGYGRKMWEWGKMPEEATVLDLGCNVKWLQWQLGANQYTSDPINYPYSDLQKSGFSADVGVLLHWLTSWKFGLSAENLIPANVGLTTPEYVPAVYHLGVAYTLDLRLPYADAVLATAEISNRNHEYTPKVGLESWHLHHSLAVRAGANRDDLSCGLSYRYAWDSADLALQLDYAFTYPWQMADTLGSHWVGMTIGWDMFNPRLAEIQQDVERRLQSARRANEIAKQAAQAAAQSWLAIQPVVKTSGPEAAVRLAEVEAKLATGAETAKLAADVVQTAAAETKSSTLTALALEAGQAAAAAAATVQQARALSQELKQQVLLQPSAAAIAGTDKIKEKPWLPEKYQDRIIVGLETKLITDFGSIQEMEPMLQQVAARLQKAAGLKVEWRLLSPAELQLALHEGELDAVAVYEAGIAKYCGAGLLQPRMTVQKNHRTDQPCYLIVRADSPIRNLAQAQGKRLGYSNQIIAGQLGRLFLDRADASHYFKSMEKQKNARDSLWALQMEGVDVVAEYAYILDIAKTIPDIQVRLIAESAPVLNMPLLVRDSKYPAKNRALQNLIADLQEIYQDPAMQAWLRLFHIEQLVAVDAKP